MKMLNGTPIPDCMIGTWAWGAGMNGSRMVFGKSYSVETLKETFDAAYSQGFTMWDTAEVYGAGNSERLLGGFIAGKNAIISTKHIPKKKHTDGEIAKAVKGSLERLNIKCVDLYWLHQPHCIKENLAEAAEFVKSGEIKNIGISNCTLAQLKEADEFLKSRGLRLGAVQNHYSLLSMDRQTEMVDYCNANGILFFGYMILEQGALSGHYDENHHFPLISMRGLSFGRSRFKKIHKLLAYQTELADKYKVDTSQIPIAWAISKGVVPLVGVTKASHAVSLAKGVKIVLTAEETEKLETLAKSSGVVCKGVWESN